MLTRCLQQMSSKAMLWLARWPAGICASQWPVPSLALAHMKQDHAFPQHWFVVEEMLQIPQEKKAAFTHSKAKSRTGPELPPTVTAPAVLRHLVS